MEHGGDSGILNEIDDDIHVCVTEITKLSDELYGDGNAVNLYEAKAFAYESSYDDSYGQITNNTLEDQQRRAKIYDKSKTYDESKTTDNLDTKIKQMSDVIEDLENKFQQYMVDGRSEKLCSKIHSTIFKAKMDLAKLEAQRNATVETPESRELKRLESSLGNLYEEKNSLEKNIEVIIKRIRQLNPDWNTGSVNKLSTLDAFDDISEQERLADMIEKRRRQMNKSTVNLVNVIPPGSTQTDFGYGS